MTQHSSRGPDGSPETIKAYGETFSYIGDFDSRSLADHCAKRGLYEGVNSREVFQAMAMRGLVAFASDNGPPQKHGSRTDELDIEVYGHVDAGNVDWTGLAGSVHFALDPESGSNRPPNHFRATRPQVTEALDPDYADAAKVAREFQRKLYGKQS